MPRHCVLTPGLPCRWFHRFCWGCCNGAPSMGIVRRRRSFDQWSRSTMPDCRRRVETRSLSTLLRDPLRLPHATTTNTWWSSAYSEATYHFEESTLGRWGRVSSASRFAQAQSSPNGTSSLRVTVSSTSSTQNVSKDLNLFQAIPETAKALPCSFLRGWIVHSGGVD